MDSNWILTMVYGLISGLTEILPVSSQAHRMLILKFLGENRQPELLTLLIDLGILAALYVGCQTNIVRIMRARRLARIPKARRKRPLDTRSLMDFRMLRTMLIPIIVVFFFNQKLENLVSSMLVIALLLLLNGIILYIPQFLPGSNRDSRTLSRVEGLLMGLGGAVSVIPGLSGVGTAVSVGSVCGIDRTYALNMTLMMDIAVAVGFVIFDFLGLVSAGIGGLSFGILVSYILAALAAFGAATLGIKVMRALAANLGYSCFAYYCWGLAMFTFILNLLA